MGGEAVHLDWEGVKRILTVKSTETIKFLLHKYEDKLKRIDPLKLNSVFFLKDI